MNFEKIFDGLTVVDLSSVLAGPSVATFFAELGANVIKIENKTTNGDVTRNWRLPSESDTGGGHLSAYYCSVNYRKTVLMLDLNSPDDHKIAKNWVEKADIVVSNFKDSSAKKLEMDYDSVQKTNPRVIFAQLFGFAKGDDTPAFDVVLQATTGYMSMTGLPNQTEPTKMPVALIDVLAAHQLKQAILVALWQRERTGRGAMVHTNLYQSAIAALTNQATNWLMAGKIPTKMGAQHPNIAPYGDTFRTCDDKNVVMACGTEKQFQSLVKVLEIDDLSEINSLKTNAERVKNRVLLNQILAKSIQKW